MRLSTYELRKKIPQEEFDYNLLLTALKNYKAPHQKINELLKSKVIIRVKKGLYVFGEEYAIRPYSIETLANLIYGPSYISMEYALSFHNMIPERVETVTSVTNKKNKSFKTPVGYFTYRYLNPEKYPSGVCQIWLDDTHPVLIASPEKSLIDFITLSKRKIKLKATKDVHAFLIEDLRIDEKTLNKLDCNVLESIGHYYSSDNVKYLIQFIKKGAFSG